MAFAAGLLLLGMTPASAEKSEASPHPEWDYVTFEVKSWGAPVSSWRILASGEGSWTEAVRKEGEPFTTPPTLAWHEIEAKEDHYTALEKILRRLPAPAPDSQACQNFMTDAPYGILRMTKGATTTEIAFNDGCFDDDYRAFVAILKEADEHVAALGKAAPVSRTEEWTGN